MSEQNPVPPPPPDPNRQEEQGTPPPPPAPSQEVKDQALIQALIQIVLIHNNGLVPETLAFLADLFNVFVVRTSKPESDIGPTLDTIFSAMRKDLDILLARRKAQEEHQQAATAALVSALLRGPLPPEDDDSSSPPPSVH